MYGMSLAIWDHKVTLNSLPPEVTTSRTFVIFEITTENLFTPIIISQPMMQIILSIPPILRGWRLPSRTWNQWTSPWMKQLTWLRIIHSGDWCLRLVLRTHSGACQEWMNEWMNEWYHLVVVVGPDCGSVNRRICHRMRTGLPECSHGNGHHLNGGSNGRR